MKIQAISDLPQIPNLKLAVIGHVEWVSFLKVDALPKEGMISHASKYLSEPAGGGAVIARKLAQLTKGEVLFFTSLGEDEIGLNCLKRLKELGLNTIVAWRKKATREAISLLNDRGERSITVIGERLSPLKEDQLPWKKIRSCDGVFITAADSQLINLCREAKTLIATPRICNKSLLDAQIKLDALVGSELDPYEAKNSLNLKEHTSLRIQTKGSKGGNVFPGGSFEAVPIKGPVIDSYGCGDSFAAGVTTGLAAGWSIEQSISLGAHCGAECTQYLGPYNIEKS